MCTFLNGCRYFSQRLSRNLNIISMLFFESIILLPGSIYRTLCCARYEANRCCWGHQECRKENWWEWQNHQISPKGSESWQMNLVALVTPDFCSQAVDVLILYLGMLTWPVALQSHSTSPTGWQSSECE